MKRCILFFSLVLCLTGLMYNSNKITKIELYFKCRNFNNCKKVKNIITGKIVRLNNKPVMILNKKNIRRIKIIRSEYGNSILIKVDGVTQVLLYGITKKNIGKKLFVVIDGKIYSAPKIMEPIKEGTFLITFGVGDNSFKELIKLLKIK